MNLYSEQDFIVPASVAMIITLLSCSSGGLGSWESDDDAEMDDEDSVVTALGCLGPLGGLLAPELQRYQKHLKGRCSRMSYDTGSLLAASGECTEAAAKTNGPNPRVWPWFDSNYKPSLICFLQTNLHFPLLQRLVNRWKKKKANSLRDLVKNIG